MLQQITQGAWIDTATPDEIMAAFKELVSAVQRTSPDSRRIEKKVVTLDAGGNGQVVFAAPRKYDWYCERITATGGPTTTLVLYENQIQGSDLAENISLDANGRYTDSFDNVLFIPGGSQLIGVFAGAGGANLQGTVKLQVRLVAIQ